MSGTVTRVSTMVLRYVYLLRGSWPRILELAYWPTVQMILWGFITQFFMSHSDWVAQASGVLLSAVLLWDMLFRAQLGVTLPFFEELYSRNLGHLFVSPLRPTELILSLVGISLIRTVIGVGTAVLLAIPLYHFSLFSLGLPLIAFFANLLVLGWAIGIMIASLVLRFGLGAESLAWVAIFALAPVSGIYYPIDTLPDWLLPVSYALPSSYVFEGMRAVLIEQRFPLDLLFYAIALNTVYLVGAIWLFLRLFHHARRDGQLLHIGE
ncbi:MAG: ABC transporter permease [Gammaproteobacteria bacterium]|nr:ABC transporter permease [Gammaproteobacteria bacterium]